jgi:hypothetical protein
MRLQGWLAAGCGGERSRAAARRTFMAAATSISAWLAFSG